jgi:polyribonucleotide nucleotidyltransferase
MASICGGTLALLDAGVPLKAPVAGVAMGLVKEGDKYAILSDIAGGEDPYGDMDFKVAGTRKGITALQMDIKIGGITAQILQEALEQARRGRIHILDEMAKALPEARANISSYAPRIITVKIPVDKIRDVIGPGGKMIRSIVERTGCKIDIEDDGRVSIASVDEAAAKKAVAIIEELTATAELNKTYLGKVVRVVDFGAFVEILPGTDGLLHVSEMANHRVKEVRDEVKEGDQILVKVVNIDPSGKIRLSRKALLTDAQGGEAGGESAGGGGSDQGGGERRSQDQHRSHDRDRGHRPDREHRGDRGGRDRGGDRGGYRGDRDRGRDHGQRGGSAPAQGQGQGESRAQSTDAPADRQPQPQGTGSDRENS